MTHPTRRAFLAASGALAALGGPCPCMASPASIPAPGDRTHHRYSWADQLRWEVRSAARAFASDSAPHRRSTLPDGRLRYAYEPVSIEVVARDPADVAAADAVPWDLIGAANRAWSCGAPPGHLLFVSARDGEGGRRLGFCLGAEPWPERWYRRGDFGRLTML